MIDHIYSDFLNSVDAYRASENFWKSRWQEQSFDAIKGFDWTYPWISTGASDCLDGNPIFSAISPSLRRGIRVIQHEPTSRKLEIHAWLDFVGGCYKDPDAIPELVISCALSEAAADCAMSLIRPWVAGKSIFFQPPALAMEGADSPRAERSIDSFTLPHAA